MHHLTKKIAITAGALTLAATGIAAAGSPPEEADAGLDTAEQQVGVELPATKDAHPGAPEADESGQDAQVADAAVVSADADADAEGQGPVDNHGAEVSRVAKSDATTGRAHGEAVSTVARQGHGPDAASEENAESEQDADAESEQDADADADADAASQADARPDDAGDPERP